MRVLIVEDEPIIALEIERIVMERLPDADVVCVSSVGAAFQAIEGELQFALLDIDVTDGKTYPLALALLSKAVPFAFVSGARADEMPQELACALFVKKPFTAAEIAASIDQLDERGLDAPPAPDVVA